MKLRSSTRALAGAVLFVTPTVLAIGCAARISGGAVATADADDVVVADVGVVPVQIETYPHYYYAGADVYFVNGRYYRRSGSHWVYYRHAPRELERRRGTEHAPPRRDAPYNADVHERR